MLWMARAGILPTSLGGLKNSPHYLFLWGGVPPLASSSL